MPQKTCTYTHIQEELKKNGILILYFFKGNAK